MGDRRRVQMTDVLMSPFFAPIFFGGLILVAIFVALLFLRPTAPGLFSDARGSVSNAPGRDVSEAGR
jgi:hypothetical protein